MPVARHARSQHGTVEHVQRRKQRGRVVALVVVGGTFDVAKSYGQHRLHALQRLALAFLVHAVTNALSGGLRYSQPHRAASR